MKMQRSRELFAKARELTPGGVHSPVRAFKAVHLDPFVVKEGRGAYLYDVDGNSYVDYICSWGPLVLGHADPGVVAALEEQIGRGTSYGASCEKEIELAELIISMMPNVESLRFVNSGTEATMSALRLARGFTGRDKIVKFSGCYHGHCDHLLVESGSGVLTLGIPGTPGVPKNITRDTLSAQFNDCESVESLFAEYPDDIAAVILEPIVGNCGMIKPSAEFLPCLRKICSDHGALLIFDEVMTGFRVDLGGAQNLFGVKPDLTCLGKVIGGGLPVGAYGGKKEIMSKLAPEGPVYQAGTLSGNPLAMTAGIATLSQWREGDLFEKTAETAKILIQSVGKFSEANGISVCAESVGTMFGIFFQPGPVYDYSSANKSNVEQFEKFFKACLEEGVLFAPSQFEAGFVSSAHAGEPLERTLQVLEKVFSSLV